MGKEEKKKIFIIGNTASEIALAKKLYEQGNEIFIASGNDYTKDFATNVDIREKNVQELLDFVLENAIDLTITFSDLAIKNGIEAIFTQNGQMIFAPNKQSANICTSKSFGKKFMYKNHIKCPKFGTFDKENVAIDYVKKSQMPIVIKTDNHQFKGVKVCTTFNNAKNIIEEMFAEGENKIIVEDYIFGHEFSFYVITDGYHALPLGCCANYKSELDGEGGVLASGMGAFCDDYNISEEIRYQIMQNIVFPTLDTLANAQTPFVGILGIDLVLDYDNNFYAIEFNAGMNSPECQNILALLDEDLYTLFNACCIGSFADDYETLKINDDFAVSCSISAQKQNVIIKGLENVDENTSITYYNVKKNNYLEWETSGNIALILTRKAKVLSRAVRELYEDVSEIKFDGMKYRKDIGKGYQD